jgi:hypothetical protein
MSSLNRTPRYFIAGLNLYGAQDQGQKTLQKHPLLADLLLDRQRNYRFRFARFDI